ncbi:hypothetical protein PAXINDRAFT_102513 [Paxillus involutus ATCC 200175]|uniref:Uncharacterized protein n=1 Tax=Paxillus involutus ATCC 200175 TaxID=664439 RepID=A0A0C9TMY8_PAXIN|nr:hypothetical protein PAXINDRAFT_102513 [Paxillus involutus ATCC 200175]
MIVSNRLQEQMARFGCILFNTLRKYGMAPDAWEEIDVYALEWFCLSIRVRFTEFRLCDNNWKAETFASIGYSGWRNPRQPALPPVAQETEASTSNFPATRQRVRVMKPRVQQQPPPPGQRQNEEAVQLPVDIELSESDLFSSEEFFFADSDLDSPVSFGTRELSPELGNGSTSISDFPPVFYDKDMTGFVEVLPRPTRFSSKPPCRSTPSKRRSVRIPGEDPLDYVQLKLEEGSRVKAVSEALGQKRQKLEILQGDPDWRAKPRAKEKKVCHVHERRSIGNLIAEQMDDLDWGKAEKLRLRKEANRKRKAVSSKASIRHRKEEKLIFQLRTEAQARAAREEQERWEGRPDVHQRLGRLVKHLEHVERAYRKEERLLLARDKSRRWAADRAAFLAVQQVRIERARMAHNEKLANRERLLRMLPQLALYQTMVMKQRINDFRKKQALATKMIEEEKETRRQQKRAEAGEAAAKAAARQRLEAQLREEQLAALRRRQREKERVAAAQEAQRKARREAEAEERAAQIKARRSAEAQARAEAEAEARARAIEKARAEADADAEERAAIRRLKARTALAGSRNLEEADGRLQTERRLAGVSTNPPSATSPHPSTTAHPSPKTPAKSKPGFRVVSSGGWRTWEAEGKATSVVQSINVKENTTAEGSRHPGFLQPTELTVTV